MPPAAEVFKVFQFPADQIPRIDGDDSDWKMVPESYSIGLGFAGAENCGTVEL